MATHQNGNRADTNMEEIKILIEREKLMLPSLESQASRIIWGNGRFINCNVDVYSLPLVPQNFKKPSQITIDQEPKIYYKGWSTPTNLWKEWVDKLTPKYGNIWQQTGIYDAIVTSTYRIKCDPPSLVGLVSHWCDETNTFLFPWGEATLTLEDVLLLGGLPVLGKSVRDSLSTEMIDVKYKLEEQHLRFNRSRSKRATHSLWLKEFMQMEGHQLEHAAFLSYWLSWFIFPSHPATTIKKNVFPIAIRLSQGRSIALAAPVLANIYKDLREMKNYLVNGNNRGASASSSASEAGPLVLWAPFQILQMWIWERYLRLRPRIIHNPPHADQPRAAIWHNASVQLDVEFVHTVLNTVPNEFQFRVYTIGLLDWFKVGENIPQTKYLLQQFVRCLHVSELVGVDCIEQYLPNRVARQLGFDQDIPSPFRRVNNLYWRFAQHTYDIKSSHKELLVQPDERYEPQVTLDYCKWYRTEMGVCDSSVDQGGSASEELIEID